MRRVALHASYEVFSSSLSLKINIKTYLLLYWKEKNEQNPAT
jgi:hypothetical protein